MARSVHAQTRANEDGWKPPAHLPPPRCVRARERQRQLDHERGRTTEPDNSVLRNAAGGAINASNLRSTSRRLRKALGLAAFRLCALRRADASLRTEAGVSRKVTAERLGHESTRLTEALVSFWA